MSRFWISLFLCAAGVAHSANLPLVPLPALTQAQPGVFKVRATTEISIPPEPDVARIARYFAEVTEKTTGYALNIVERPAKNAITFALQPSGRPASPESYELTVAPGEIKVSASTSRGLFYGAMTLIQLFTGTPVDASLPIAAVHIKDEPRFAWRGLMLDSARHYQSPEFIERFIDWMAFYKLNVLHWHLTDDQAWRLEIKQYPKLTSVGAWRVPAGVAQRKVGGFYSQSQVRRIVEYAKSRNVTIIPEIEMPGHATAAIVAYPELGVLQTPPGAVPSDWGIYSNLFNVEESTFTFLQNVLVEVIALFPGEYVHVGGDEAVKTQWKESARVQQRMRELKIPDEAHLQSYFIQRVGRFLHTRGRRLIGWDEILEGGLARDATVMSWRGGEGAVAAAKAGHDAVLSPAPVLYFDHRQTSLAIEPPGRGSVVSLEDVYGFEPVPAALTAAERTHILGLQGNLWTEHVRTEARVAWMVFPRAAAVAEIGWSPAGHRSFPEFLSRVRAQDGRYRTLGLNAALTSLSTKPPPPLGLTRKSQELKLCSDKIVLSLEDDAPLDGQRAAFLVDILNPCWIFEQADLSRIKGVKASVGQLPFNFQVGDAVKEIPLPKSRTAAGELEVRVDRCEGEPVAVIPLASAVANPAVTVLPPAKLQGIQGLHDLCFQFTRQAIDPYWVIDQIQLVD